MDGTLRPVLKRQILFLGSSLAVGFIVSYFFNVLVGLAANMAVLLGLMLYMRRRQLKAMRAFGFSDETAGGRGSRAKLRYICLACGEEVTGTRCGNCGSNMKKPLF